MGCVKPKCKWVPSVGGVMSGDFEASSSFSAQVSYKAALLWSSARRRASLVNNCNQLVVNAVGEYEVVDALLYWFGMLYKIVSVRDIYLHVDAPEFGVKLYSKISFDCVKKHHDSVLKKVRNRNGCHQHDDVESENNNDDDDLERCSRSKSVVVAGFAGVRFIHHENPTRKMKTSAGEKGFHGFSGFGNGSYEGRVGFAFWDELQALLRAILYFFPALQGFFHGNTWWIFFPFNIPLQTDYTTEYKLKEIKLVVGIASYYARFFTD
ncbi:hypothetical protein QVD17_31042 [Tagetes erecta]|uniref:Uncharacterized protein n=1 Tax=Tagetes erecta TaxID=13708 RepID=A0AAD8K2M4_TARER|nr:hypothetical protein QVD17_31042 [Tagetes erecta]